MAGLEAAGDGGTKLVWVAHPFRRSRGRGLAILALILAIALGLGAWMGTPFWGLFALFVLGLSLESFFLPTRYELGADGIAVQKVFSRSAVGWERFRRIYEDRHGLTLSPYSRRTVLEPYRSVRLLFDGGDKEEIRRRVRALAAPEARWMMPDGKTPEWAAADAPREGETLQRTASDSSGKRTACS